MMLSPSKLELELDRVPVASSVSNDDASTISGSGSCRDYNEEKVQDINNSNDSSFELNLNFGNLDLESDSEFVTMFNQFVVWDNATGTCDASRILSDECFRFWVEVQKSLNHSPSLSPGRTLHSSAAATFNVLSSLRRREKSLSPQNVHNQKLRSMEEKDEALKKAFRDEVFLHLTGSQGRKPFPREIEQSLLELFEEGTIGFHQMQEFQQQFEEFKSDCM